MSTPHRHTLTGTLNARLIKLTDTGIEAIPVQTEFRYAIGDPWAVTLSFRTARGWVQWSVSRDVLIEGLQTPAGPGDVHIEPLGTTTAAHTLITLYSPDGRADFVVDTEDLSDLLTASEQHVPRGTEADNVDLDTAVAQLAGDGK